MAIFSLPTILSEGPRPVMEFFLSRTRRRSLAFGFDLGVESNGPPQSAHAMQRFLVGEWHIARLSGGNTPLRAFNGWVVLSAIRRDSPGVLRRSSKPEWDRDKHRMYALKDSKTRPVMRW